MRRPLCALALAVTAVMYLVLRFLPPALPDYAEFDGSTVRLQGRVLSKEYRVSKNGGISLLITLGNIHCPSGPSTKNHVLVRVPVSKNDNKTEYEGHMSHIPREFPEAPEDNLTPIGALICVTGKVRAFETARNPGEFDARLYYRTLGCDYSISGARVTAVNGKRSVIGDTLYRLRRAMAGVFDRCLSQEDASVMKALLLGEKGWLDQETKELYRRSGIIHILAVSGLHISLVGLGITGLLRQIHAPKCLQRLLAPLVVSIYCLMAGPGPSSVRALIMYLTSALGYRIGRTPDFLTSLSLAEIFLLLRQPLFLYHTGFLFSFAAALSIGALMPVLPGKAGKTLAIPALTLPVYMVSGYTFPLAGVFLNFLVLPFMQTLMISGGAVLAAGFLSVRAGRVTSLCCHVILYFYKALCTISQTAAAEQFVVGHAQPVKLMIYLAMIAGIIAFSRWIPGRLRSLCLLVSMLFLITRCPGNLRLFFLDVGQGDGIVLEYRGHAMLIDAGSSDRNALEEYTVEPYLFYEKIDALDYAVVTHPDQDHCGAVKELLERQGKGAPKVRMLLLPSCTETAMEEAYRDLLHAAARAGVPAGYLETNMSLHTGGLTITCLHPEKDSAYQESNAMSVTLLVSYGKFRALLTGDLEGEGEKHCLSVIRSRYGDTLPVTVLKAAHHGSSGATTEEFLNTLRPAWTVISCGRNNPYGHPHKETIRRLRNCGSRILDTRECGGICFETDGSRVFVSRTQKP